MVNTKGKEPSSLDFDSYIELLNRSPGFYGKSNMKKSSSSSSFSVGMHNSNQESFASSIGNSLPHFSTPNATDSDMYGSTYHVLYGEPLINLPVSSGYLTKPAKTVFCIYVVPLIHILNVYSLIISTLFICIYDYLLIVH